MRIWIRNTAFFLANLRIWLRTGTPQKFADLRWRNQPIHLRICDLRSNKKIACAPVSIIHFYVLERSFKGAQA
jgi:hypothetical protein